MLGVRDTTWLAETVAMSELQLTAGDFDIIAKVLDKGRHPQGDIYSWERRKY